MPGNWYWNFTWAPWRRFPCLSMFRGTWDDLLWQPWRSCFLYRIREKWFHNCERCYIVAMISKWIMTINSASNSLEWLIADQFTQRVDLLLTHFSKSAKDKSVRSKRYRKTIVVKYASWSEKYNILLNFILINRCTPTKSVSIQSNVKIFSKSWFFYISFQYWNKRG